MQPRAQKIGVFDSGFGGVDILRGITIKLPGYDYVYLGDTARAPYGTRSQEIIYQYCTQAVDFLFAQDCAIVIFACNTASSEALRKIQMEYLPEHYPGKKVLGVLIPAAQEAVQRTRNGKIGVIATEGTITSDAFTRELLKADSSVGVFQQACPILAPIVEAGEHDTPATKLVVEQYLTPLLTENIDTLILGCTHYGILEQHIKEVTGPGVAIISEARVTPKKLEEYFERHPEIEEQLSQSETVEFFSTDLSDRFTRLGSQFYGRDIEGQLAVLQ